jgi:hypothetical protein
MFGGASAPVDAAAVVRELELLKNRSSSFVIDGEAVLLGVDGVPDFDGAFAEIR